MDVKDLPEDREYRGYVKKLNDAAEHSAKRKGEIPNDFVASQVLVLRHMMILDQDFLKEEVSFRTTQMPPSYRPCTKSIDDLSPMLISEMRLETQHRGRKITLSVLTPPNRINAVTAVVEDRAGKAVLLQLHHLPGEEVVPAQETVYGGRVCVLKEPFFRDAAFGGYNLRVDHVNDIVWLTDDDPQIPTSWQKQGKIVPTSLESRVEGNEAVKKEAWATAARLYTSAIESAETNEEAQLARLNRSFANLKPGHPEVALSDAAGHEGEHLEKSLFREACALFELARYEECLQKLSTISTDFPENTAIKPYVRLCKTRIEEALEGKYSFRRMYKQTAKANPIVDCATYSKPVETRPSPGRGRGVFTNRAVSAGELLVCEKAFGYCYSDEDSIIGRVKFLFQVDSQRGYIGGHADMISQIVQKLQFNPESSKPFLDLSCGDYEPSLILEVDVRPVVDTKSLDDFIKRMGGETKETATSTCGIWITASHINHSCVGNCSRNFIGDVQIIRATCDMPGGTEIMFPYESPNPLASYSETQENCKSWGFECDCVICTDKKTVPPKVWAARKELMSRLKTKMSPRGGQSVDVKAAAALLEELEGTYAQRQAETSTTELGGLVFDRLPRLGLEDSYMALGISFLEKRKPKEALTMAVKGLRALGFDIIAPPLHQQSEDGENDLVVLSWDMALKCVPLAFLTLFAAYGPTRPELAAAAKRYVITSYAIVVGESETVLDSFPELGGASERLAELSLNN